MKNPYNKEIENTQKVLDKYRERLEDYEKIYVYSLVKHIDNVLPYADNDFSIYEKLPVPNAYPFVGMEWGDEHNYGRFYFPKHYRFTKKGFKSMISEIVGKMNTLRYKISDCEMKILNLKRYSEDYEKISVIRDESTIDKYMRTIDPEWVNRDLGD